jgi:Domain of unknown function (DUF4041)/Meiotically up-regulated gene 113
MSIALLILLAVAVAGGVVLAFRLRNSLRERDELQSEQNLLLERFRGVIDAEAERTRVLGVIEKERIAAQTQMEREQSAGNQMLANLRQKMQGGEVELASLQTRIQALQTQFNSLDEEANLQSFGFYKPHYDFADSERYQAELEGIRSAQKGMLKGKSAAVCHIEWTVNGSKVEGRKSTNQILKLMLRAFNGECDAAIAKVKYNNIHVMEARIKKAYEVVNGLAEVQRCEITKPFLDLKLKELYLAHEYQEKLQEEKEEQRRIREQMREEEIAQRELEKARLDAEREEQRYAQALAKAREEAEQAVGAKHDKLAAQIEELQRRLQEAHSNKERAIARAQMTRSGHVYVISNLGSFGEQVYKIGMTRRLDPFDRIKELGDASVPFQFDVHAVIFSEDAPALENKLHREFQRQRVNRVNERKEFFKASIDEIANAVLQHHGEIEITRAAEAEEYRKTLAIVDEELRRQPAPSSASMPPNGVAVPTLLSPEALLTPTIVPPPAISNAAG